jgi:hypothetical protein
VLQVFEGAPRRRLCGGEDGEQQGRWQRYTEETGDAAAGSSTFGGAGTISASSAAAGQTTSVSGLQLAAPACSSSASGGAGTISASYAAAGQSTSASGGALSTPESVTTDSCDPHCAAGCDAQVGFGRIVASEN